jgi:hypothetical protein
LDYTLGSLLIVVAKLLVEFQHSGRNVIVLLTRVYWLRLLDGDLRGKLPVHHILRHLLAFPRPSRQVYALGLPRRNLRLELAVQFIGNLLRRPSLREVLDDVRVPSAVQVWWVVLFRRVCFLGGTAKECNRNAIPASVIVGRRVERLVPVADEVNYESQCVSPRLSARARIAKHGQLVSNYACDAAG